MSAFRAAGSQHLTAISRLHTLTEAMYTLTAAAVRLVGTFHAAIFRSPREAGRD
jgi:hypothetical protein